MFTEYFLCIDSPHTLHALFILTKPPGQVFQYTQLIQVSLTIYGKKYQYNRNQYAVHPGYMTDSLCSIILWMFMYLYLLILSLLANVEVLM